MPGKNGARKKVFGRSKGTRIAKARAPVPEPKKLLAQKFAPKPKQAPIQQPKQATNKPAARGKIRTEFDRVLEFVRLNGKPSKPQIAWALGMKRERVQECCDVLEQAGLVKIHYPAVGPELVTEIRQDEGKSQGKGR